MYTIKSLFAALLSLAICHGTIVRVGEEEQYVTVHEAAQNIANGDTIEITAGTYEFDSSIEFFDAHNILVYGQDDVNLVCNNMDDNVFWIINSTNITIRNMTARHTNPPDDAICVGNVIGIDSSEDILIEACNIQGCGAIGVYIWNSSGVTLKNNHIYNNTIWAVEFEGQGLLSENNSIDGLTFEDNLIEDNGTRISDDVIYGMIEAEFIGVEIVDYVHFFFADPVNGSTLSFRMSDECTKCADILADPDAYTGKFMKVEYREVNKYIPEFGDYMVVSEIIFLELTE